MTTIQQRIDELWKDLVAGDIDTILKNFAKKTLINLPKNDSNSVIPFVGVFEDHQGVRDFFSRRDAVIQTTKSSIESIHHQASTAFLNVKTEGFCKSSGKSFKIDDVHVANSIQPIIFPNGLFMEI